MLEEERKARRKAADKALQNTEDNQVGFNSEMRSENEEFSSKKCGIKLKCKRRRRKELGFGGQGEGRGFDGSEKRKYQEGMRRRGRKTEG